MTALPVSCVDRPSTAANAWILRNYKELRSRAGALFSRSEPGAREEAVAEVLALVTAAAHRAAARGRLGQLTAYWSVVFTGRQARAGRRAAGTSSRCVLSEAARLRHGIRVVSLDRELDGDLEEALADRDGEDPAETARRNLDYPRMLADPAVSDKARHVFDFLAQTHGEGRQLDLAATLMVSPGRVTQLKAELAGTLGKHGYHGPLGRRPSACRPRR